MVVRFTPILHPSLPKTPFGVRNKPQKASQALQASQPSRQQASGDLFRPKAQAFREQSTQTPGQQAPGLSFRPNEQRVNPEWQDKEVKGKQKAVLIGGSENFTTENAWQAFYNGLSGRKR